ncbi:hypothetical protein O1611_g6443 [Lasiodiplodia mahajangana]|uniref:Uncharacterized protein n=1 Tax=Lasiodiplodia mahajangana TaxID=1108764 RepID=A0ACC2JIL2_9PEZI|nr:hypothetical protein O1611_g6443 [Lasiodiplodia mahajangana]
MPSLISDTSHQLLLSPNILHNAQEAHQITETTIQLIPLLAPRALRNSNKQHLLSQAAGLASDAAAITLKASKGSVAAIQILETSRGILTSNVYDLRADVSILQKNHSEFAKRFTYLQNILDAPVSSNSTLITSEASAITFEDEANQRREAYKQLNALIKKIRGHPSFERFLLPPSKDKIQKAARNSPIVIINISSHSCDALIIELSDIRTWIPTGPLAQFPLHAARNHQDRGSATALDRVISSYCSSVRAIVHARQQKTSQGPVAGRHVTLVAMEETPGQASLRFASKKINAVQTIYKSIQLHLIQPESCKKEVLSSLGTSWIFHFARHGGANSTSLLHSQLLLRDWAKDALTQRTALCHARTTRSVGAGGDSRQEQGITRVNKIKKR